MPSVSITEETMERTSLRETGEGSEYLYPVSKKVPSDAPSSDSPSTIKKDLALPSVDEGEFVVNIKPPPVGTHSTNRGSISDSGTGLGVQSRGRLMTVVSDRVSYDGPIGPTTGRKSSLKRMQVKNSPLLLNNSDSIFLKASLQLLEERSELSSALRQALSTLDTVIESAADPKKSRGLDLSSKQIASLKTLKSWAVRHVSLSGDPVTSLPAGVICGYLYKLGGSSVKKAWQKRYVVLDAPNLLYFSSSDMSDLKGLLKLDQCTLKHGSKENQLELAINGEAKKKGEWTKKKTVYTWMAGSATEYKYWYRAINKAAKAASSIIDLIAVRQKVKGAVERTQLLSVLEEVSGKVTRLPVNFIHEYKDSLLHAPSEESSPVNNTKGSRMSGRLHIPFTEKNKAIKLEAEQAALRTVNKGDAAPAALANTMSQVEKDMKRDKISIDGEVFAHEKSDVIIENLANKLLKKLKESTGIAGDLPPMSHAHAIAFARRILLGSARTVSGGDAYDGLRLLFQNPQIVIAPESTEAEPVSLQISASESIFLGETVFTEPDKDIIEQIRASTKEEDAATGSSSGSTTSILTADTDWLLLWPIVRATVTSTYKVCNMDPDDEDDINWAKIQTSFCKTFRMIAEDQDEGVVMVKVFDVKK